MKAVLTKNIYKLNSWGNSKTEKPLVKNLGLSKILAERLTCRLCLMPGIFHINPQFF